MIGSKHISKISILLISLTLVVCVLCMVFQKDLLNTLSTDGQLMEYETKLFDTEEIIDIDIQMDADQWTEMLDNAINETYYSCNVVINGTEFDDVGIRPKGNTSLSSVAHDPDNNRYSFKIEFDKFVDGQTCWGLDKLVLNNSFSDATNMKEALVYDMFEYLGADASLYNYSKISVNGEYWGVYLALEAVEESFMLRNYSSKSGHIYKPDGMNMGGASKGNMNRPEEMNDAKLPVPPQMPEDVQPGNMQPPSRMPDQKGFMGRGGGADLNYTDDNLDSYYAIWDGAITNSSDSDHLRIIQALKNSQSNPEDYLNVDNMLKYMAVHNFVVNDDSLSGNMAHNYYLYEEYGKINIIPWDYNFAFGGMGRGDASSVVNRPVDDSYESTTLFDVFLNNEEYLDRYHQYYNQLVQEYVLGGKFEETYNKIRTDIDVLTQSDPNSNYTYEQYTEGCDTLYNIIKLRGESVKGQLAGTIPSTTEGQYNWPDSLIDASSVDVSTAGAFGRGGPQDFDRRRREVQP